MFNNYFYNPAYTGSGELLSISAIDRSQWSGYRDYMENRTAPSLKVFNVSGNIDSTGHHLGFQLSGDKLPTLSTYSVQVSYAYHIDLSKNSTLAFGVRGGMISKTMEYDQYRILHANDPYIPEGKQAEYAPDVTLGLWYDHRKYYFGFAVNGILPQTNFARLGMAHEKGYTATTGYRFRLSSACTLTPGILGIAIGQRYYTNLSIVLNKNNNIWGGLAYTHDEAASMLFGFSALDKKINVTYAYDHVIGAVEAKATRSHEIQVQYKYGNLDRRR
jgi:type IX secretion system PorP/SprF family membrane protein